jgi:excisionase family DNA binding protein
MAQDSKEPPLRVSDVAAAFGVSGAAVRAACKSGRIRAYRLNRAWLIPPDEVDRISSEGTPPEAA